MRGKAPQARDIPHQNVNMGVKSQYQGIRSPIAGVSTSLFNVARTTYLGRTQTTNSSGLVTYELPQKAFTVRADFKGYQWWSGSFTWAATEITIPEGTAVGSGPAF